jgi:hypothetical protein
MSPTLTATKTLSVLTPDRGIIGTVQISSIEEGRVHGEFIPAARFDEYEPIFRRYTEIVENQAFTYLDQIESEIARLGITIRFEETDAPERVYNVQIFTDGGFSCRLLNP